MQAVAAIQSGQVQTQTMVLRISCLSAGESSILSRLRQCAQMPPMPQQLLTPVTPETHSPPATFPVMPSSNSRLSSIPHPTISPELVLAAAYRHRLSTLLHQPHLWSQTPLVCPHLNPVYGLPPQASNSLAIWVPRECAAKQLQQELDEIKQRYAQIQEEKTALNRKNTELLAQYDQAVADRSRVDHELLSVRSENSSLSEEKESLKRKLRDAYGKNKDLEQHQKERDKKRNIRCDSIKEEWQTANISLRAELKESIQQRDESIQGLQKCQNELKAVLGALEKEVVKREEREREIQVLRSREVVEPEILKALRAVEGLANKGTVTLQRLPGLLSVPSAPYAKKEDVNILERMVGE